jgi:hypothetical protein
VVLARLARVSHVTRLACPRPLLACAALLTAAACQGAPRSTEVAPVESERVRPRVVRPPGQQRLFAGEGRTCLLGDDATWCWGVDPRSDLRAPVVHARPATIGPLRAAARIAFAARAGCASFEDGDVECWRASEPVEAAPMIPIRGVRDVRCLAASAARMAACTREGEVVSWSFEPGYAARAEPLPDVHGVVELVAGDSWYGSTACARHEGDDVRCWKWDVTGGPAPFWTARPKEPFRVRALAETSADMRYAAMDPGGVVRTFDASLDPVVSAPGAFAGARALSQDVCLHVLDARGAIQSVDCIDDHAEGALRDVEEVAGAIDHGCARLHDGAVWCWGDNRLGQLGDGTREPRSKAVRVAPRE